MPFTTEGLDISAIVDPGSVRRISRAEEYLQRYDGFWGSSGTAGNNDVQGSSTTAGGSGGGGGIISGFNYDFGRSYTAIRDDIQKLSRKSSTTSEARSLRFFPKNDGIIRPVCEDFDPIRAKKSMKKLFEENSIAK